MSKERPALRRAIGPKLLLLFVLGDILGTGIYALTGDVAGTVGGAAWLAFGVAFLVAFCTAASYVELVGKYPQAAGAALYTQRAFGRPFLTFLVAFAVMASGLTSAGAASRSFAGYFQELAALPVLLVALAFLLVLAAVNLRGVAESVKLNIVLTCVELAGLLIVVGTGALALARGVGDAGRALEFNADGTPFGLVVSGAALAFFALVGFEDSVNMAEETTDPPRIFPRAVFGGLAAAGVLYMAVAFFATALVPIDVLAESDQDLLEVVRVGAPSFPLGLFSLIAMFAVSNSALINMMMASRLVYGLAREDIIPPAFGAVHAGRRTPWVAILFTTALVIALASWGGVRDLGGTTALLLLCVFALVNLAVLVLRRRPVAHAHYRAPTALPLLGVVSCAYLASPLAGREPRQYWIAGALMGIGVALWVVNWALHAKARPPRGAG
ncbi:MAG TPA: APC family permease [Gammaproteobacteria bacterium]